MCGEVNVGDEGRGGGELAVRGGGGLEWGSGGGSGERGG